MVFHTHKRSFTFHYKFQQQLLKELTEVQAPKYLGLFEKILKGNQGGDGFFVGSKVRSEKGAQSPRKTNFHRTSTE